MTAFIFGATGMLGHEVNKRLKASGIPTKTISRFGSDFRFDAERESVQQVELPILEGDYLINCIGLISHLIDETSQQDRQKAESINTYFPRELEMLAKSTRSKVIQIATDCVFAGDSGSYNESSRHDARDVYGWTKSAGEISSPAVMNLRTSIIGKEMRGKHSLLEWVLGQPIEAEVRGYTDRMWNGITTTAFGRIVSGIILSNGFIPGTYHVVPADKVSKFELISLIARYFGRSDLKIKPQPCGDPKDLTLSTLYPEVNQRLWKRASYPKIPSIEELLEEISPLTYSI